MKITITLTILLGAAIAVPSSPYMTPGDVDRNAVYGEQLPERVHPLEQPLRLGGVNTRGCAVRAYGCEDGYCWDKCSSKGEWCWLALERGRGDWVTCRKGHDEDCAPTIFRDAGCGQCDKDVCGCSC
jgi:hypothetical protein